MLREIIRLEEFLIERITIEMRSRIRHGARIFVPEPGPAEPFALFVQMGLQPQIIPQSLQGVEPAKTSTDHYGVVIHRQLPLVLEHDAIKMNRIMLYNSLLSHDLLRKNRFPLFSHHALDSALNRRE